MPGNGFWRCVVEPGDLSDIAFGLFAKHTELVRLSGDRIALKPELVPWANLPKTGGPKPESVQNQMNPF